MCVCVNLFLDLLYWLLGLPSIQIRFDMDICEFIMRVGHKIAFLGRLYTCMGDSKFFTHTHTLLFDEHMQHELKGEMQDLPSFMN